ncbi:MAG: VCBS repeat-containing protein, partial [Planctomycetaceae bacterium]
MPRFLGFCLIFTVGLFAACGTDTPAVPESDTASGAPVDAEVEWFVDRAEATGLNYIHFNGMTGGFYTPEMMGPGVGLFDYDNDGDLDVYIPQGELLGEGEPLITPPEGQPLTDRLFRNDLEVHPDGTRTLRFTDVTNASGLRSRGYGIGVATGDYDNDGWVDLYVTRFGPNQMFRNLGDGTFLDVSAASGTDDASWGAPATFLDYDRDGFLDLFVGNYLAYTLGTHTQCYAPSGVADYCAPESGLPQSNVLYRNQGNGTFVDVTVTAGLARDFGPALGNASADFNNDGWIDLFVANDQMENQLWINQQDGTFQNMALLSGAAL